MRRFLNPDLLIIVGLFLLPLAFFWQVTLGDRTLLPADNLYQFQPYAAYREQLGVPAVPHNALLSDLVLENLVWKTFIRQSFAQGELPLWNPYIFAGVPFLAAGQHSALYPFSIIYYIMPLDKAYGWFTVSQLWLAGLFMFLFARGLGIGRFGATIAAIAYQLSAFFVISVVFQMIIAAAAWLPFLLLMVEFTIRQRPLFGKPTVIPWVALGAVGLGMEILAGHVEFTYYALLVMGFWAACRLSVMFWQARRRGTLRATWQNQILKPAAALIVLVVLGVGVGAIQFIPLLELASKNFREGQASFDTVRGYAYPPRHALAFLIPNLYGSPAQHDYYDMFSGELKPFIWQRSDGATVTDTYWQVGKNYVEGACYVGLLTLVLAAIAMLNAWFEKSARARIDTHAPYRGILFTLSVISLLFIFGTPAYAILYFGLPGINQLHSPFRWVFPLTLCLAVLAGFGAEALKRARRDYVDADENAAQSTFMHRVPTRLGYPLVGIGAAIVVLLLLSRMFFDQIRPALENLFQNLAGANTAFPNVETFYSVEFRPILFFGLFLILCGCVVRVSRCPIYYGRGANRRPVWQIMALVTLALDLIVASTGFNPAADPKWLSFVPPAIQWLKDQNPQEWRFIAIEGRNKTMNANIGWLHGLQDVAGYDSIIPKQYVEYVQQVQPQHMLIYNRIAQIPDHNLAALDTSALDTLAVKYVVADANTNVEAYDGYTRVYSDDANIVIYENTEALPRAYLIFNDAGEQIVDARQHVKITESRNIQVQIDVNTTVAGTLVLTDSYFPGWRAYVRPSNAGEDQETEIPIALYNGNFRSVPIEPGNWTVRFRYSPPPFQLGVFTTFMSLVVLLFAVLVWLWRAFYTEGEGDAGNARRFAKNSLAPIVLNLFNRGIDFAFAAIMLRVLGPADAGIYYYAVVVFGWFDTITNFGLNLLLTREVARDRSSAWRYLLNSSLLRVMLAGAGVPILIAFLAINNAIKPMEPLAVTAIFLLYVGLVPNSISYGLTALFYAFEKAEIPAATSTVIAILKAVFGLGALLMGWGVIGLAAVSIVLNLFTLAIMTFQARDLIGPSITGAHVNAGAGVAPLRAGVDRALMRDMVIVGWPLMLNNLLAGLFYKIDVTLMKPMLPNGAEVVGQYSTAYKWLDALGIIPSLFTMALLPIMSRQAQEDKPALERNYHFAVKLLVSLALPVAVVTTIIAPHLIAVLGGARYLPDGAIALQLMVWFFPVGWINSLTNYVLIALDQQRPMRWAFVAGVGFNILANLVFIPLYSYRAAAIITILSEVVLLIGFTILLRKALAPVNWFALVWKPVVASLAMLVVFWLLGSVVSFYQPFALLSAVIAYPATLFALRPFNSVELERLQSLLPRPLRRFVNVQVVA